MPISSRIVGMSHEAIKLDRDHLRVKLVSQINNFRDNFYRDRHSKARLSEILAIGISLRLKIHQERYKMELKVKVSNQVDL